MERQNSPVPGPQRRRGPIGNLLGLFSNVWFGIFLLVLIFVYSTLGSAYPPFRQAPWMEMTEFEYFNWWPFTLLIALMVTNLVTVTIRRIKFNTVNLGVWMIHTGIVILALGSVYYFSTKVEGDAPIFRRRLAIQYPGLKEPAYLLCRPGNSLTLGQGPDARQFQVMNIQPDYSLRTEGHEGEKAYAVQVAVRTADSEFIRQVLAGYPQFTEDVVPGKGRAIKVEGKALLDESLDLRLEYEPQQYFYLQDSAALYSRLIGEGQWQARPIKKLPHYHERFSSRDEVWLPADGEFEPSPLDIALPEVNGADALSGCDVHVTGYLRYAFDTQKWLPGGDRLNPVCRLRIKSGGITHDDIELAALDRSASTTEEGHITFVWAESPDQVEALARSTSAMLHVSVPEANVNLDVPVADLNGRTEDAPFVTIEGTDYAYRVKNTIDRMSIPGGRFEGQVLSLAVVEIKKGDRVFQRWVADVPEATRDIGGEMHEAVELDTGIVMHYHPGMSAPLTVVAGPEPIGTFFLFATREGVKRYEAPIGKDVNIGGGVSVALASLYENARRETRPAIVPDHERNRDARKMFSMIKVAITHGNDSQSFWLPYNDYAMPSEQYGYPGRISYNPTRLTLPNGKRVELMYSREKMKLPSAVVLEDFKLETHQGGLKGTNNNVRDYISTLRFADGQGGWTEPVTMSSNNPASNRGFWYFQSTWDPPARGSAGMNYTGAGIGNRNGVFIQLLGCCIAVTGMIYAFYFKPIVMRRRQAAAAVRSQQRRQEFETQTVEPMQEAPVA
jgi:hypothetical protein